MGKILWVDVETTGLNCLSNAITQLAAIIEIDGTVAEEVNLQIRPLSKHKIDPEALEVSGTTVDEINAYPHNSVQFKKLEKILTQYVNRYEKLDKFIIAGYNISAFDVGFLRQFFMDNAATRKDRQFGGYFGSWFFWPTRDVQTYVAEHIAEHNLRLDNYKLSTVCNYFNIPIQAHDALSDIQATRTLYNVLRYSIPKTKE